MTINSTTAPVTDPTWYGQIRDMFTSEDRGHMARQGLDLASYGVVEGKMPPGQPWSPDWVGKRSQAKWCRELRATSCD
ncbi:hypothetical protein [Pseudomonas sp. PGPR40]|uniref:hypothetical protein n=1 Tax=Pseudomonas sp. PGPR40 TaxID=2913476 RepID=UPI001EDA2895|nr:hypothetical protein [Pseudomonas sp. PGPR40]